MDTVTGISQCVPFSVAPLTPCCECMCSLGVLYSSICVSSLLRYCFCKQHTTFLSILLSVLWAVSSYQHHGWCAEEESQACLLTVCVLACGIRTGTTLLGHTVSGCSAAAKPVPRHFSLCDASHLSPPPPSPTPQEAKSHLFTSPRGGGLSLLLHFLAVV